MNQTGTYTLDSIYGFRCIRNEKMYPIHKFLIIFQLTHKQNRIKSILEE